MSKTDKEIAAILVRENAPRLTTKEISEFVGMNSVTLRSWPTKGFIKLLDTETSTASAGRGNTIKFGPLDVAQFIFCADMVRLNIAPSLFTAKFTSRVTLEVLQNLHTIAETELVDDERREKINEYYNTKIAQIDIEDLKKKNAPAEFIQSLIDFENSCRESALNPTAHRYVDVFYSPINTPIDNLIWHMPFDKEMIEGGGMFSGTVHIVYDCLDAADKLIKAYRKYLSM